MDEFRVGFPGGRKVDVHMEGMVIHTDQPVKDGGQGSAPTPSQLFLASIASCAGYYALIFCEKRGIDTRGMGLEMRLAKDDTTKLIRTMTLVLTLPDHFPEKYRPAILKAMDACWVKKHLVDPPRIEMVIT